MPSLVTTAASLSGAALFLSFTFVVVLLQDFSTFRQQTLLQLEKHHEQGKEIWKRQDLLPRKKRFFFIIQL